MEADATSPLDVVRASFAPCTAGSSGGKPSRVAASGKYQQA
eukprot:CAMPEP_0115327250 /NCGR_PEP_ID=MMETSP0270-20121206/84024_1 /TAXON_ID=71861 /ORGANISM="Scrippsiella trochoidea, Strain CCMP3099" /LENGTH=40 /DNA_ID= /DNA_START= /DNA_END= /DNA_ORIENTATION=